MNRIIDFHTHPFLGNSSNICAHKEIVKMGWEDILPTFTALGVEKICGSVILKAPELTLWERIMACNDMALQLREKLGEFYYPGFHIHPDYIPESVREIQRFAEKGFRLVGELVPYIHGWEDYSCKAYSYLLDVCQEYDMVVNMHSMDLDAMEAQLHKLEESLPCRVDGLLWLLSEDDKGRRFVSIFNNEGNTRSVKNGDVIDPRANARVKVTLQKPGKLECVKSSADTVRAETSDGRDWYVDVPAAGFVIFEYR